MNEWIKYSLEDLAEIQNQKRVPLSSTERAKRQGVFPYYGASGIVDHIDDYIFEGEYVLVSEDGENLKTRKTPIAFKATGRFWVNNHAHILKFKKNYLSNLVIYYFQNLDLNEFISGAVQPKLNKANLVSIPIFLPKEEYEQKAIAAVLSCLDDKIDLLHRQNKTLESMAETLFRHWFIDGAQEDWEVGTLSDIAINSKDTITTDKISDDLKYVGLEHIERRSIALHQHGFGIDVSSNKFIFKTNDILFGKLRPYFHKVCFASFDGICSTDILVIRPKKVELFTYCLFAFFQNDVVEFANLGSGGTRMPRTDWTTKVDPIVQTNNLLI
jgi:type I restriction enzyme S subunit